MEYYFGPNSARALIELIDKAIKLRIKESDLNEITTSAVMDLFKDADGLAHLFGQSCSGDTPVGSILPYMGTSAPDGYLVCDGSEYQITDYPALAQHFEDHFELKDYFGGDGEYTFKVPDLRDMFLRGYHDGNDGQLSGEIGIIQDPTILPHIYASGESALVVPPALTTIQNPDMVGPEESIRVVSATESKDATFPTVFATRPVNVAVLWIIKAKDTPKANEIYSEEETVIGQWIDGSPLYRRVIKTTSPDVVNSTTDIADIPESADVKSISGMIVTGVNGGVTRPVNFWLNNTYIATYATPGKITMETSNGGWLDKPVTIVVEYTKSDDIVGE